MAAHPVSRLLLWLLLALVGITALQLMLGSISIGMFVAGVVLLIATVWGAITLRRRRPDAG